MSFSLILLLLKNYLCAISVFLNLWRLVLWIMMWSVVLNVWVLGCPGSFLSTDAAILPLRLHLFVSLCSKWVMSTCFYCCIHPVDNLFLLWRSCIFKYNVIHCNWSMSGPLLHLHSSVLLFLSIPCILPTPLFLLPFELFLFCFSESMLSTPNPSI